MNATEFFDAHLHIIDPRFPLWENRGYLPQAFSVADYLERLTAFRPLGGAVVSGSFQRFDQSYLLAALDALGPGYVGVVQLPASVEDAELDRLHRGGVRAVRFNLQRGGSADVGDLTALAIRVHSLHGWHVELYADTADLVDLKQELLSLPRLSIDHLGLSAAGLPLLRELAAAGVRIKATGFGRVDFDVAEALQTLHRENPDCLMFGTDLPSTRAPRPFRDSDISLVESVLGAEGSRRVLCDNALTFYRLA